MLVAAAVCPHPPLLIPQLAGGASAELDDLRAACATALAELAAVQPDVLVVVGADSLTREWPRDTVGSLAGFGVGAAGDGLPLSLTVGTWLLSEYGATFPALRLQGVDGSSSVQTCADLGARLADSVDRVALLVMGDGTARLSAAAPGAYDERAPAYDNRVRKALAAADADDLLALDPAQSESLLVAGRAPWQVLAGACGPESLDAQVVYADAPYGVAYYVALWVHHG